MRNALTWLLDLQDIPLQDGARLGLQFLNPFAGWLWLLIAVVTVVYVILVYRRETTRSWRGRAFMGGCRIAVILMATTILSQPALVYRQERTTPATVAIVVDDSASMARQDLYDASDWPAIAQLTGLPADAERRACSRWQLATAMVDAQRGPLLRPLLEHHRLRLFRFAGSAARGPMLTATDAVDPVVEAWVAGEPAALSTHIAPALEQVYDACADAHLAGIVLITDGQATRPQGWESIGQLSRAHGAPVFVVLTGDPVAPLDLAVTDASLASHVYLGDHTVCRCRVRATGLREPTPVTVTLRPRSGGTPWATHAIVLQPDDAGQELELAFDPPETGAMRLVIEVDALPGEQDIANNRQSLALHVVEDRARVLYVEGTPRYEFRYLKNILIREASVTLSTLLLSADDAFVQDGNIAIRRFPTSAEELDGYDVVLLGDVDPRGSWITPRQLELLAEFVSRRGGGLGLLAGERHMPHRLYGSALEALVPLELSGHPDEQLVPGGNAAFRPRVTPAGADSPILRLLLDASDPASLIDRLPQWFWTSPVRAPRAGAEVLLEHPTLTHHGRHLPILVVRRHGAGTVLFHGSDDTWRWRRYRGEAFVDTFWLQCVRHLAMNKRFPAPQGVSLRCDRKTFDPQEAVTLILTVDDSERAAVLPDEPLVDLTAADGTTRAAVKLQRSAGAAQHFQATFVPETTGRLTARFDPARYALDLPAAETDFEVVSHVQEQRHPEADRAGMELLSAETGGALFTPSTVTDLATLLPDKHIVVPDDISESIWDSKLTLMVFGLLLLAEWIVRKRHGLV